MDKQALLKKTEQINTVIEAFLPKEGEYDQLIVNAMNYSVLAGGKRLRPLMMQTAFHVFANDTEEPEILHRFMTAIECIHTYSLCHDDLPAMDNDMMRRGKLCYQSHDVIDFIYDGLAHLFFLRCKNTNISQYGNKKFH